MLSSSRRNKACKDGNRATLEHVDSCCTRLDCVWRSMLQKDELTSGREASLMLFCAIETVLPSLSARPSNQHMTEGLLGQCSGHYSMRCRPRPH